MKEFIKCYFKRKCVNENLDLIICQLCRDHYNLKRRYLHGHNEQIEKYIHRMKRQKELGWTCNHLMENGHHILLFTETRK